VKLSFLDSLYASPGPYASVYLDTSGGPRAALARWRHARDELARQGADAAILDALAGAVGRDAPVPGPHGRALFAARGRLLAAVATATPPGWDTARFGPLPHVLPLVLQRAPDLPYATVLIRPDGAADGDLLVDVETGRWPAGRIAPGPRSRRRYARRDWRRGASEVAGDLTGTRPAPAAGWAARDVPEAVVVCGPEPERGRLVGRLPAALRARVTALDPAPADGPPDPRRALLEDRLAAVLGGRTSARDRALTGRFLARRDAGTPPPEGLPATVGALRRDEAEALLVNPGAGLDRPVATGRLPDELALTAGGGAPFGVSAVAEQPAGDALVRAAAGAGADVVVVPEETVALGGGVGVLPRGR
jgi:hypothetical protein